MDSPKSNPHPTVDPEMTTDLDAKVESDPDIKADSETDPKAESDPNSKADSNSDPKASSNPDLRAESDSSPAAVRPWPSDMGHDQFMKSLVAFYAERGYGPRLHLCQWKLLTAFNAGHN